MNGNTIRNHHLGHYLLLLALLVLSSYWIFVNAYRINAFDIVPHDDYAPYLLYILGEEGGQMPGSPFAYRLFSVALAAPFFYILPYYQFTRLENVDVTYLQAVEALAMLAYVSILGLSILIYLMTTKRLGGSPSAGLIASLGSILLMQFSGYKGVDPVGIMLVCALVYWSRRPLIFAVIIFLSIGFNEKISLVLALLMLSRFVIARDRESMRFAALSILAFGTYLAIRLGLDIPGNDNQILVADFAKNAWDSISAIFSLKRVVLEIIPVTTMLVLYSLAAKEFNTDIDRYDKYFSRADVFALVGLYLVTLAIGMRLNTGRIAMFCVPFYLPLAAIALEKMVHRLSDAAQHVE